MGAAILRAPVVVLGDGPIHRRLGGFAVLSGIGWVVDFCAYNAIATLHFRLFYANIVGAAAGMATVFIGGRLSLFRTSRSSLPVATGLYVVWSVIAVLFASALIDWVGTVLRADAMRPLLVTIIGALHWHMPINLAISTIAKLVITPLTMLLNFCAMNVINGQRTNPHTASVIAEHPDTGVHPDVQLRSPGRPGGPPM